VIGCDCWCDTYGDIDNAHDDDNERNDGLMIIFNDVNGDDDYDNDDD